MDECTTGITGIQLWVKGRGPICRYEVAEAAFPEGVSVNWMSTIHEAWHDDWLCIVRPYADSSLHVVAAVVLGRVAMSSVALAPSLSDADRRPRRGRLAVSRLLRKAGRSQLLMTAPPDTFWPGGPAGRDRMKGAPAPQRRERLSGPCAASATP